MTGNIPKRNTVEKMIGPGSPMLNPAKVSEAVPLVTSETPCVSRLVTTVSFHVSETESVGRAARAGSWLASKRRDNRRNVFINVNAERQMDWLSGEVYLTLRDANPSVKSEDASSPD